MHDVHPKSSEARLRALLDSVNWSFSTPFPVGRSGLDLFDCRKYHWYPATFIPEIPFTLIELLSKPDDVVYDPFAGIGTTVLQALLLGRRIFATENCAVAAHYIHALILVLRSSCKVNEVDQLFASFRATLSHTTSLVNRVDIAGISIGQLKPWYNPGTFNQLMFLVDQERRMVDGGLRSALRIALSATLKAVCSQDRGWGCIADNVLPKAAQLEKKRDALDRCYRLMKTLVGDMEHLRSTLTSDVVLLLSNLEAPSCIFHADVVDNVGIPDGAVDLVISSPPYPNMTDYALSQRLSYYWLGIEINSDLVTEIGARRKRTANHALELYSSKMQQAAISIGRKVKLKGYACFVMPKFEGGDADLERQRSIRVFFDSLVSSGFEFEHSVSRLLPTRRRQHNQKWARLNREDIYVYRKVQ